MLHGKRSAMVVHEEEPFNAETARGALAEASVTSTGAFFSRKPRGDPTNRSVVVAAARGRLGRRAALRVSPWCAGGAEPALDCRNTRRTNRKRRPCGTVGLGRFAEPTPGHRRREMRTRFGMLHEDLGDTELRELLQEGWQRQNRYLTSLIEEAHESGQLSGAADPATAAGLLLDLAHGCALRAAAASDPSTADPQTAAQQLLDGSG